MNPNLNTKKLKGQDERTHPKSELDGQRDKRWCITSHFCTILDAPDDFVPLPVVFYTSWTFSAIETTDLNPTNNVLPERKVTEIHQSIGETHFKTFVSTRTGLRVVSGQEAKDEEQIVI